MKERLQLEEQIAELSSLLGEYQRKMLLDEEKINELTEGLKNENIKKAPSEGFFLFFFPFSFFLFVNFSNHFVN